jgi:hypothetical protein
VAEKILISNYFVDDLQMVIEVWGVKGDFKMVVKRISNF